MRNKNLIFTLIAILAICLVTLPSAYAYFTTYAEANGGHVIHLGDESKVIEKFDSWTKHVQIHSDEGSEPVYVRLKAFSGSQYTLTYSDDEGQWAPNKDGYLYYIPILKADSDTSLIDVMISDIPETATAFNVVVIYETTPVQYDEAGRPYADWSYKVSTVTLGGE